MENNQSQQEPIQSPSPEDQHVEPLPETPIFPDTTGENLSEESEEIFHEEELPYDTKTQTPPQPEQDRSAQREKILQTLAEETEDVKRKEEPSATKEEPSINFDLMDVEGRWLLKVISGPNIGAEFSLHANTTYIIGTDTKNCDIIFQDMSVSRKHAKLILDQKNALRIEDLESKNGTFVDSEKITATDIQKNSSVTMGTTTFLLLDRDAEATTIVAKISKDILPTVQKEAPEVMQGPPPDLTTIQNAVLPPLQSEVDKVKNSKETIAKKAHALSSLVILSIVTGLLMITGVGATYLFRTEEIATPSTMHPDTEISKALSEFPTIRYSYNPVTHRLLLVGHLLTPTDRNRLLDELQGLSFVKDVDYNNVVIDELVWQDFNQTLAKNPAWKGISITAPSAGHFVLTGFLQTKKQSKDLLDYISQNFPYLELLERKIIVEEDLLGQINRELTDGGFRGVTASLSSGDLTLSGSIPKESQEDFMKLCALFKSVPGIHSVHITVSESGKKESLVDLTGKYTITGYTKHGSKKSVVIAGKFLSVGDVLDGMHITEMTDTTIYLEKDNVKYKIDFNYN